MYYVYVLKSARDGNAYIGSTHDLKKRVRLHNSGSVQSTQHRRPLELVYYEAYKNETDARKRECGLKLRSKAYAQLKKRIAQSLV